MPEFEDGGVERYVIQLCHEQISHNHQVALATAGGKLEKFLPPQVEIIKLPVQRKNLFTGLYCAFKLAYLNKKIYSWDIIHAHSRVPAFIAWIAARLTKTKWLMTAHAPYSLNLGIMPLKHADGAICVSQAVYNHLQNFLPDKSITIANGAREAKYKWHENYNNKFLFVGYLAKRKGLDTAIKALSELKNYDWTLDVLGDGSQRSELEELVNKLELGKRVKFYGFRDDAEKFMSEASCLLFPSHQEGLPLTVNEALAVGLPVIASDIEPLRPLLRDENSNNLIPVGDISAWCEAIQKFLDFKTSSNLDASKLTSFKDTALEVEKFYLNI